MKYLYETHLHTSHSSACSHTPGADYIQPYIDQGYTGIIVTDHFFHGNTAISRKLPWREWVKEFYRGYEEAKNEGDKRGLDVFFGWEEMFDSCDEYLIYGLSREWLFDHEEARGWSRLEQYRAVRAGGGCVVHAHPFRERDYIKRIILPSGCADAIEIANYGNESVSFDALAKRYAQKCGLPATAGTDIHDVRNVINGNVCGIYFDKKPESPAELVQAILNNQISGLKMIPGRCDYHGNETISLPLEVRDEHDNIIDTNLEDII